MFECRACTSKLSQCRWYPKWLEVNGDKWRARTTYGPYDARGWACEAYKQRAHKKLDAAKRQRQESQGDRVEQFISWRPDEYQWVLNELPKWFRLNRSAQRWKHEHRIESRKRCAVLNRWLDRAKHYRRELDCQSYDLEWPWKDYQRHHEEVWPVRESLHSGR